MLTAIDGGCRNLQDLSFNEVQPGAGALTSRKRNKDQPVYRGVGLISGGEVNGDGVRGVQRHTVLRLKFVIGLMDRMSAAKERLAPSGTRYLIIIIVIVPIC